MNTMTSTSTPNSAPDLDPTPAPAGWVYIVRQYGRPLAVGPYPSPRAAEHALEHALLVDGLCEIDCLDAWSDQTPPTPEHERIVIDPDDPDDTGAGVPDPEPDDAGEPEDAEPGCSCGPALDPFERHGRACELYDGWRE